VPFKGACFLTLHSISPLADSDLAFLRALMVVRGEKIRTLHKNSEECGTRKFNTLPKPCPPA
jgi:hypothetical protein